MSSITIGYSIARLAEYEMPGPSGSPDICRQFKHNNKKHLRKKPSKEDFITIYYLRNHVPHRVNVLGIGRIHIISGNSRALNIQMAE